MPSYKNYLYDYGDKVVFMVVTSEEPQKSRRFFKRKNFTSTNLLPKIPIHRKMLRSKCLTNSYIIE